MAGGGLDLRKFPRYELKCDIQIGEDRTAFKFNTTTQNIGAGGVCVILNKELPKLTRVFTRLHMPDYGAPIECHANVCWVVRSRFLFKNESLFDTGLEFMDIRPDDRERIRLIVEKKLEQG
ncbi:MAG: PilZ domain-containing protein [Candidatus Omnitrophica bacterium]|nr:PilZ domain-containing protein [Candidatus Omnitrophota bacterium]